MNNRGKSTDAIMTRKLLLEQIVGLMETLGTQGFGHCSRSKKTINADLETIVQWARFIWFPITIWPRSKNFDI